jgi:hypothetical protein
MNNFFNVLSTDIKSNIRQAMEQIAAEPGTKVFDLDA